MKNLKILLTIILGLILSIVAIFAHAQVVFAQTPVCYDARGNIIECPPRPENKNKKTPTPQRRNNPPSATATLTPTFTPTPPPSETPVPSGTPTPMPALPTKPADGGFSGGGFSPFAWLFGLIIVGGLGGGLLFLRRRFTNPEVVHLKFFSSGAPGEPISLGSTDGDKPGSDMTYGTARFEFDVPDTYSHNKDIPDQEINSRDDDTFILKRAARINYETSVEDTDLLFQKQKQKGSNWPLQTEFDIPSGDTHSKDSTIMENNSSYDELGIQADTESDEDEHEWDVDGELDAGRKQKPENYFEEEHATRTGGLPPKKFPKVEDKTDTGRASDDDD